MADGEKAVSVPELREIPFGALIRAATTDAPDSFRIWTKWMDSPNSSFKNVDAPYELVAQTSITLPAHVTWSPEWT